MSGDGWREVQVGDDRARYRRRDGEFQRPSSSYEVQYWNPRNGGEWRDVVNGGSRDWFALGMVAGRAEALDPQTDLFDASPGGQA